MKAINAINAVRVVFEKEMRDGVRDWRSMLSALMYPLLGPAMIMIMFFFIADTAADPGRIVLSVDGIENAPNLIAWFEQNDVEITEAPSDPMKAVKQGKVEMVISIPDKYRENLSSGRLVSIDMITDSSRKDNVSSMQKVRLLIDGYSHQLGALRLVARGINPEVAVPITVHDVDTASNKELAAAILAMMPLFVIMAAFVCGMQIAIDATAGERERGSLESLLINPAPRTSMVLGKWATAATFSGVGIILTLIGCLTVLSLLPVEELGFRLALGPKEVFGMFAATVPMAFMAPGLQMLVSTFARSYKEAQTYVSLLIFLPMLPFLYGSFSNLRSQSWMVPIPALGQQALISDVLAGEPPDLILFVVAGCSSLLLGLACVSATARLFKRESIIFGR